MCRPETIRIEQVPAILRRASHEDLVRDVLSDLAEFGTSGRIVELETNYWERWRVMVP